MGITYIDTSAFLKVLVQEAHSKDVRRVVTRADLWSSTLLGVEAHRAGLRLGVRPDVIDDVLSKITLIVPSETTFMAARSVGNSSLRTLDALHLAAALELETDLESLMTFDRRLASAGADAGIAITAPGLARNWWAE